MSSDLKPGQSRQAKPERLDSEVVAKRLQAMPLWQLATDGLSISREFRFDDFHQTIAFVNAVAWVAHQEDHHPDMEISYNRCMVRFSTHSVGGLSDNDIICADRLDALTDI